ncbi:hypothetical protein RMN57_30545 [Kitasatospora sp. CM 4170]|uniref:Uncharacterized protein n=1 Tax=Kitasatospora aburaviensis TaxID=67265 RepID=A0ABW1ERS5_9ACTN|nr:hypothetical protein [Kitasatospora sp. CM 4170]WNM48729.1 hypothetical protein RMN57_30545 [Kitasatospora sp. CM 4170]
MPRPGDEAAAETAAPVETAASAGTAEAADAAGAVAERAAEPTAESAAESATARLRAHWAAPPTPVPPWYRRVSPRVWKVAGGAVAVTTAIVVLAAVLGPDDPVQYRLDVQQQIGDLTRDADTSGAYAAQNTEMFPDTLGYIRFREHFVAGYRLPGSTDADFVVVGATGAFASPVRELDDLLGGVDPALHPDAAAGHQVAGAAYTVFPPGPLGGALKCTAQPNGTRDVTAVCAWADSTTVGSVTDLNQGPQNLDLAALAERTRTIRAAMTRRVGG